MIEQDNNPQEEELVDEEPDYGDLIPFPAPRGQCVAVVKTREEVGITLCCGQDVSPSKPYCPEHCSIYYTRFEENSSQPKNST